MSSYKKYNIKQLEQSFIAVFLLKSRFGTSDIMVPFGFYGDCSHYLELPKPDEIYDYEKYTNIDWIKNQKQVDDVKEKEITNKQPLNFTL